MHLEHWKTNHTCQREEDTQFLLPFHEQQY